MKDASILLPPIALRGGTVVERGTTKSPHPRQNALVGAISFAAVVWDPIPITHTKYVVRLATAQAGPAQRAGVRLSNSAISRSRPIQRFPARGWPRSCTPMPELNCGDRSRSSILEPLDVSTVVDCRGPWFVGPSGCSGNRRKGQKQGEKHFHLDGVFLRGCLALSGAGAG